MARPSHGRMRARWQLGEVTPVRGDDEEEPSEREGDPGDDISSGTMLELRDLRCGEPDPGEQDEQESDFGEVHTGVMRQSDGVHTRHSSHAGGPFKQGMWIDVGVVLAQNVGLCRHGTMWAWLDGASLRPTSTRH
jgi:hypothetical protein